MIIGTKDQQPAQAQSQATEMINFIEESFLNVHQHQGTQNNIVCKDNL
jgi:hypothetical protein